MRPFIHHRWTFFSALLLVTVGCQTVSDPLLTPPELARINAAINRHGLLCPHDYCLEDWPASADLDRLEYWDCKAYAVAKADQLIRLYGYAPERLEYVLVEGPPLRVAHAALLVDGRWVLDIGLRCQLCALDQFASGLRITGRLLVADLSYVRKALRASTPRRSDSFFNRRKQKD